LKDRAHQPREASEMVKHPHGHEGTRGAA
jgi:hypothetical protein